MKKKKLTVYFDVENTLEVPFITGIQRVTREFAKYALSPKTSSNLRYVPVILDASRNGWRPLSAGEKAQVVQGKPRSLSFFARLQKKLTTWALSSRFMPFSEMEAKSLFLDIDSSWHNSFTRDALLPKLKRAGITVTKVHYDIIPITHPKLCHPQTTEKFTRHFLSHLHHCNLFMCISHFTRKELNEYAVQHKGNTIETTTIRLGTYPSTQKGTESKTGRLKQQTKTSYGRFILVVGTIEPRKNHQIVLDAMEVVFAETDLNLVLVGKPGWNVESTLSKIQFHPEINTRLFHIESASDDTLDALYRSAWLSVVPSFYEGFGLPVVESLSRGCPTLSSTSASLPEVGKSHVDYFSPADHNDLASKIISLYCEPGTYRELVIAAKNFNPTPWETTFKDIDSALSSISSPTNNAKLNAF